MGGFIKVIKNRAYFKRFQVKFKRRRLGVTDYAARRKMISQDKNKYGAKKYRMIVRMSNKKIICQAAYATLNGDITIASAESSELPRYGMNVGLTNYAAAYCTGLLLARRLLQKYQLDTKFIGNNDPEKVGDFIPEQEPSADVEQAPFKLILDIGLARSSTGARIFGALKGAVDGGCYIPHSESRFPGFDKESKELDAKVHRDRIYGVHVAEYMASLRENNKEAYERQFSKFIAAKITPETLSDMYKKVHEAIRKDPSPAPKKPRQEKPKTATEKVSKKKLKSAQNVKIFLRNKDLQARKNEFMKDMGIQA